MSKPELQPYCNYPEISKAKLLVLEDAEICSSSSSSSSSLPSFNSAFSKPSSWLNILPSEKESVLTASLFNYYRPSSSSTEPEDLECLSKEDSLSAQSPVFEGNIFPQGNCQPVIDPVGWIKYASDQDPWNVKNYSFFEDDLFAHNSGTLTHQLIFARSSKLDQLPDSKAFVLTRLHLNKQGLEDISVMSGYQYFQYIDVSWNFLADLEPLSNCNYLMYLNASHNRLTEVLGMKPPWFLTHANLCCNQIREIGQNLSEFWSLRHLDLSYNLIEKIQGLSDLKYLRFLNLSHNYIKKIENLNCISLEELDLQFNEISECATDSVSLPFLEKIKTLNLSHNRISHILPFQELYTLKKLDISDNRITELHDINHLIGPRKLYELNLTNNPVCSNTCYREFVIWKLPSLKVLDFVAILSSERVAAKMLFGPDIFTRTQHIRTKAELWSQLANKEIHTETMPNDQPPVPLVLLAGTFANRREDIAKTLVSKFPDQFYRFKKYTTMPSDDNYELDNLIHVPTDEFNSLIKSGQFISYYKEIGYFFGIGRDEMCKCIIESKVGLIDTIFEAAMVFKSSGLQPLLVLNVMDDVKNYSDRLRAHFMDLNLWSKYPPTLFEKQASGESNDQSNTIEKRKIGSTMSSKRIKFQETLSLENKNVKKRVTWNLEEEFSSDEHSEIYISSDATEEEPEAEEEDFLWTWSIDSSTSMVSEPDENFLNMLRGREKFVKSTLEEQELYVEVHNLQPGLFVDAVLTDDVEVAAKKVKSTCFNIFKNRKNQNCTESFTESSACSAFVKERVKFLMKDFLSVSNEV